MRKITNHIVPGDDALQLEILVLDEPGTGGANYVYSVRANFGPKMPNTMLYEVDDVKVEGDGSWSGELCRVSFQNGPIKEAGVNGVTQEAFLAIVIDRLTSFQAGPYPSTRNAAALDHCHSALTDLQARTRDRIARGVEGKTEA